MCDDVGSSGASDSSSRARKSALSCGDARASSQSIVARVDIGGVLTIGAGGDVVTIGTVGAMLAVAVAVAVADGPVTLRIVYSFPACSFYNVFYLKLLSVDG